MAQKQASRTLEANYWSYCQPGCSADVLLQSSLVLLWPTESRYCTYLLQINMSHPSNLTGILFGAEKRRKLNSVWDFQRQGENHAIEVTWVLLLNPPSDLHFSHLYQTNLRVQYCNCVHQNGASRLSGGQLSPWRSKLPPRGPCLSSLPLWCWLCFTNKVI